MAIDPVASASKAKEGPTIDNKPSQILTFTAQELKTSHLIPGLLKTVNLAYQESEQKSLGASTGDRLKSVEELILVLRDDPESFIMVLVQPHAPEQVLSTATCRRYCGPHDLHRGPWACTHTPADDTEEWELKLLATHPSAQGKGVASYMLALAEEEVVSRFQAKVAARGPGVDGPIKAKMIICTPKPLFGKWYAKRGYQEDYIRIREKTSEEGDISFEIAFMSKPLAATK